MFSSSKSFEDALDEAFHEPKRSKRILRKVHLERLAPPVSVVPKKKPSPDMSKNDSDDDFEIVGCFDAIKWFFPIDKNWQRAKCEKFGLMLKSELDLRCDDPIPATEPTKIHEIEGDGNCYFRCLSYLITGSVKSHKLLRRKLVNFMKDNGKLVEGLGGPKYLESSMMWVDGMWPTEVEIYASACMLDTDIYTHVEGKWLRFSSSGKLEIGTKVNRGIYLQNKENVHYDVVLEVQEPKLLPPSRVYSSKRPARKKPEPVVYTIPDTDATVLEISLPNDTHTLELPRPPSIGLKRRLDISIVNDVL